MAKGLIPVPDVGAPPFKMPAEVQDTRPSLSAFVGGEVYLPSDDPLPEFNYVSPLLVADGYDNGDDYSESYDSVVLEPMDITPQDSLEDVPLSVPPVDLIVVEPLVSAPAPAAVQTAPPAMLLEDEVLSLEKQEEVEDKAEYSIDVMVAVQIQVRIRYHFSVLYLN